jgi:chorismate mutase
MSTYRQPRSLRALRGATTVSADDGREIVDATAELLEKMLAQNAIQPDDIVSVVLTATPDLTAEFPAAAARRVGLSDVALLCASEIAVQGAVGRCIRVLMHLYTDRDPRDLEHVYLRDARRLRTDRESKGKGDS